MSRKMVNSTVKWIGDIPLSWHIYRNKYLFNKEKNIVGEDWNKTQLLSLTTSGIKKRSKEDVSGKVPESYDGYQRVRSNQMVMCLFDLDCSAVFSGISPYDGMISPAYNVLNCTELIDAKFADYWFQFVFDGRKYNTYSKNIRFSLSYDDFKEVLTAVPSLPEQRAIVRYLDAKCSAIDEAIERHKKIIEKLEEYRKAEISRLTTKGIKHSSYIDSEVDIIGEIPSSWTMKRLKYLCDITTGDSDTQDRNPDGEYPFYVRSPIVERSNHVTFEGEGILMAGDGAGAGRIFHLATGKYAVHQRVYRLYNIRGIQSQLLMAFLSCKFPDRMDQGSAMSTVPSVRLPMLKDFVIPIPPLDEQVAIVEMIERLQAKVAKLTIRHERLIEKLEEYRKSIIYNAVTGKIDCREEA